MKMTGIAFGFSLSLLSLPVLGANGYQKFASYASCPELSGAWEGSCGDDSSQETRQLLIYQKSCAKLDVTTFFDDGTQQREVIRPGYKYQARSSEGSTAGQHSGSVSMWAKDGSLSLHEYAADDATSTTDAFDITLMGERLTSVWVHTHLSLTTPFDEPSSRVESCSFTRMPLPRDEAATDQ